MFTNIPNNYASMRGELTFEYNCTDESDILIEVINDYNDAQIGVKKFYSTTSAKVNVAPIIYDFSPSDPSVYYTTGLYDARNGFPRIRVEANSEASNALNFSYSTDTLSSPMILTSMPLERILYVNERDLITVVAPDDGVISCMISCTSRTDEQSVDQVKKTNSTTGGVKVFLLIGDIFRANYKDATLTFYSNDEVIGSVYYTLSTEYSGGYRVAWVSEKGSIEHYTFPLITEHSRLSSGEEQKTLRSAYGTQEEIEGISEIVGSLKVWRNDSNLYTPIEVATTELTIEKDRVLTIANIKILENG